MRRLAHARPLGVQAVVQQGLQQAGIGGVREGAAALTDGLSPLHALRRQPALPAPQQYLARRDRLHVLR
jgi:hypothetical protein